MPPNRYVAFLRAVNVGGRVVRMDALRKHFVSMGYSGVQTFIASGNVLFESSVKRPESLERAIEAMLKERLGFEVGTFLRSLDEVAEVARHEPFDGAAREADGALYIVFLRDAPSRTAARTLLSCATGPDRFEIRGREVYWAVRGGFAASVFSGGRIEKLLGMDATVRNSTTVRKLAAKFAQARP